MAISGVRITPEELAACPDALQTPARNRTASHHIGHRILSEKVDIAVGRHGDADHDDLWIRVTQGIRQTFLNDSVECPGQLRRKMVISRDFGVDAQTCMFRLRDEVGDATEISNLSTGCGVTSPQDPENIVEVGLGTLTHREDSLQGTISRGRIVLEVCPAAFGLQARDCQGMSERIMDIAGDLVARFDTLAGPFTLPQALASTRNKRQSRQLWQKVEVGDENA